MSWYSCAYTIHTIENLLRDVGKPLFGELSSRQSDCLSALVRFSSICAQFCDPLVVHTHCHRLLNSLLHRDNNTSVGILDIDAFGLLVTLTFLLPYLVDHSSLRVSRSIPRGSSMELSTLQLIYVLHALQILISTDFSTTCSDMMDVEDQDDDLIITDIYSQIQHHFYHPFLSSTSSSSLLEVSPVTSSCLLSELQRRR